MAAKGTMFDCCSWLWRTLWDEACDEAYENFELGGYLVGSVLPPTAVVPSMSEVLCLCLLVDLDEGF